MRKFYLILLFCFLTFYTNAQFQDAAAIDSIFQEWNHLDTPGAAVGIVENGQLVYAKGFGIADLEHDIKISSSSVFYIGSVSKQFVTFCVLLLEEAGKINLDDPIQKYLPDFPEYESPLTIRHFIHHTSGVRDYLTLMYLKGRDYLDNIDVDEVYELIKSQQDLNFTPGEKYLYSNSCYFMLAMIVEIAAGESIRKYAQKNIFGPLGMEQTLFYDDNSDLIKNRVFSYRKSEDGDQFDNLISRFDLVGSGGIYSSIEDLYLWDQNFYHNKLGKGGQDIILKMHKEGLLNNGESSKYAFALINGKYKGLNTVSHGGALAGYRSQLMRFPDQKTSVIVLANRADANPTSKSYQVVDLILKDQFIEVKEAGKKEKEVELPKPSIEFSLKQMTGTYEIQAGVDVDISIENDSLHVLQNWNNAKYKISKTTVNTFQIVDDASIIFVFSELEDDKTQMLTVYQNGSPTKSKRKKEMDVSKINLDDYVGFYFSEELNEFYNIILTEGSLQLKMAQNSPVEIKAYAKDQFNAEVGLLRFDRKDNYIIGFELDAGRVQNLKFKKRTSE